MNYGGKFLKILWSDVGGGCYKISEFFKLVEIGQRRKFLKLRFGVLALHQSVGREITGKLHRSNSQCSIAVPFETSEEEPSATFLEVVNRSADICLSFCYI